MGIRLTSASPPTMMRTWLAPVIGALSVLRGTVPRRPAGSGEGPGATIAPPVLPVRHGWWGNCHNDDPVTAAYKRREIVRSWREACEPTALAHWVPAPAGMWRSVPLVEKVILGNPTSIIVRLRPGQLPSDVQAHADRIAYTMEAGSLRVSETGIPMRLRVEFLDRPAERVESDVPPRPRLTSVMPPTAHDTGKAA